MNPNWYPGYYFDPKNMWEGMPDVMDPWLPASLVRTPPEIPPESWPEPSSKPSYGLLDDLAERLRPKSLEERLAALPTLLRDVVATPTASQTNSSLWGGLLPLDLASQPAQWPDVLPVSMPPPMPTAESSPPPMLGAPGVVPTLGGGPPARIAGWPYDVPGDVPVLPVQWPSSSAVPVSAMPSAPPVQHMASAGYWGAAPTTPPEPLPNHYLAPVPPAPNWNEVATPTASEARRTRGVDGDTTDASSPIDEAATAQEARRAAAMRLGQWRRRGTQEYEPPAPPPPAEPSVVNEAAEAQDARRSWAMRTGQWRLRGTQEYEPPGAVAPVERPIVDEVAAAEEAYRAAAMRTGEWRRRGKQEYEGYTAPPPSAPQPDETNPDLSERSRLNLIDSYYRNTVFGSMRLALLARLEATPDVDMSPATKRVRDELRKEYPQIIADLARYDRMRRSQTLGELGATAWGKFWGTLPSPENFAGLGAGMAGKTLAGRVGNAAAMQGGIATAADLASQLINIYGSGVQDKFDWGRWLAAAGIGAGLGGGAQLAGEIPKGIRWLRFR